MNRLLDSTIKVESDTRKDERMEYYIPNISCDDKNNTPEWTVFVSDDDRFVVASISLLY